MRSAAESGAASAIGADEPHAPTVLVFDSGLGGLTVYSEVVKLRPDARYVYAADDAGFPYGEMTEGALVGRVLSVVDALIEAHAPAMAVIACNTASTLVLPHLRARWADLPFIGTVPAVKPAAALSRSKLISVMATPGTVARDYTRALIEEYAAGCRVALVAAPRLAALAEAALRGEPVDDAAVRAEIAPGFVEEEGRRTDTIVLACTHFPLLQARLQRLAPWPVNWVDPAPAIARQAARVLAERWGEAKAVLPAAGGGKAVFTSGRPLQAALARALGQWGLAAAGAGVSLPAVSEAGRGQERRSARTA